MPETTDATTTDSSTRSQRLRWLQFSLRTLLVLMLLAQNVARGGEPAAGWDGLVARHKELLRNVEELKDYTCVLHMQEPSVAGKTRTLVMTLKVRHRPFSVYARFHQPADLKRAEVLSVEGRNGGRLLLQVGPGLPDVWLDPASRLARLGGIRPFTQVDMRTVFRRAIELLEKDSTRAGSTFKWRKDAKINGRVCSMLELNLVSGNGDARVRTNLFVDDELQLPIRFAIWNVPAGTEDPPTIVEEYTFADLQTDVGLTEEDFSETNPTYFFDRRTAPAAPAEPKDKPAAAKPGGNDSSMPRTRCRQ